VTPDEATIARYWREVWTDGNLQVAAEVYAATYEENSVATNPAEFVAGAAAWLAHFSDFRVDVEELFSVGNRVVTRVIYRGTHTGDFKRMPARGRSFSLSGLDVFEFEAGMVVRHWHETDHLEQFRHLGADLRHAAE
jgi:steroid delta-isomerase-like uncharacterized protein